MLLLVVFILWFGRTQGDSRKWIDLGIEAMYLAIAAAGVNILLGYTGLLSLGHAAFFVSGGYAGAILSPAIGIPPWAGFLFAFASTVVQAYILLVYWSWQAFHYGRQNIGIYSFASIAETGKSPHAAERLAIDLGTVLGIAGTFKVLAVSVSPDYLRSTIDLFYQAGNLTFFGVLGFSIIVYLKFFRDTTVFKTVFYFASVLFFYPIFISTSMNVGFFTYAMAHGLQYLVFMAIVSANGGAETARGNKVSYRNLVILALLVLIVGFAFWRVGDLRQMPILSSNRAYAFLADFLFGAVLGATMSHFVVDASAWKLRLAPQRAYISKRFDFIFNKNRDAAGEA